MPAFDRAVEKPEPDAQRDAHIAYAADTLLGKWGAGGAAGRKRQREREEQARNEQNPELRRCLIRALIREKLGVTGKPIGKLRLVRDSAAHLGPDAA